MTYDELIEDMLKLFNGLKAKAIKALIPKPSECKYCHPEGKAYSFHHPKTAEFVFRYVIHQKSKDVYFIGECQNIPPRKDGMPF